MKIAVLLGNLTFHHFVEEELALFKTDNEHRALVHEIEEIKYFDTKEEAYEEADNTHHLSWIIPSEFNGEVAFENKEDEDKYLELFRESPNTSCPNCAGEEIYKFEENKMCGDCHEKF